MRDRLLKKGRLQVVSELSTLPKTTHDANSFVVDVNLLSVSICASSVQIGCLNCVQFWMEKLSSGKSGMTHSVQDEESSAETSVSLMLQFRNTQTGLAVLCHICGTEVPGNRSLSFTTCSNQKATDRFLRFFSKVFCGLPIQLTHRLISTLIEWLQLLLCQGKWPHIKVQGKGCRCESFTLF